MNSHIQEGGCVCTWVWRLIFWYRVSHWIWNPLSGWTSQQTSLRQCLSPPSQGWNYRGEPTRAALDTDSRDPSSVLMLESQAFPKRAISSGPAALLYSKGDKWQGLELSWYFACETPHVAMTGWIHFLLLSTAKHTDPRSWRHTVHVLWGQAGGSHLPVC